MLHGKVQLKFTNPGEVCCSCSVQTENIDVWLEVVRLESSRCMSLRMLAFLAPAAVTLASSLYSNPTQPHSTLKN